MAKYKPIIDKMTWSYTRIKCFEECPYQFFLRYIYKANNEEMFYSSFGKFMHGLLEQFYNGQIKKEDLKKEFLLNFSSEVKGERPSEQTVCKYIKDGLSYLDSFEPIPLEKISVESKQFFKLNNYNFVGVIDYLGLDGNDLCIVDHKSKRLKPRSKKKRLTKNDKDIEKTLDQLYLYAVPIEREYKRLPKYLCINSFLANNFIKEPFRLERYEEIKRWAIDTIHKIEETDEFNPEIEYFRCKYLCGLNNSCEYYQMFNN